jgi:hypothetical protein
VVIRPPKETPEPSLSDKIEESPDAVAGIGAADTSEMIKVRSSATRPARERIIEYGISVGPADRKVLGEGGIGSTSFDTSQCLPLSLHTDVFY